MCVMILNVSVLIHECTSSLCMSTCVIYVCDDTECVSAYT